MTAAAVSEHANHADIANGTTFEKFHAADVMRPNSAVHPDLNNPIRRAGGIDHGAAFLNRMASGFFHKNMCPGLDAGEDCSA